MAIRIQKASVTHRPKTSTKEIKGQGKTTRRIATKRNNNVKSKRVATRIK